MNINKMYIDKLPVRLNNFFNKVLILFVDNLKHKKINFF